MGWRVAVDRGGTFADVVAHGPHGAVRTAKLLAHEGVEGRAVSAVLTEPEAASGVDLRVGTTVATNALLTAAGAPTALLVTRGFGDLPRIGHQARREIFALAPRSRGWGPRWVVEVDERITAVGLVERELLRESVRESLVSLRSEGCRAVVVALTHAVDFPAHELALLALARECGFSEVVASHEVVPRVGLMSRGEAAVLDGSLTPVVREFVCSLGDVARSRFMTSGGGLVGAARFRGRNALLSGPAGGATACARLARELGLPAVLGFDMGGTSTDVCRWAGDVERREVSSVAGREVPLPGVDVVTVAAGGGSRLRIVDGVARVGPDSVGASPGPASYGRGGQAAVTDANCVLGRIQPRWFPRVFGEDGAQPLAVEAARAAVRRELSTALTHERGLTDQELLDAAAGFVSVANQAMSEAIAALSISRGHDPREHALVALGGAGPQHACAVAELLGIPRVVVHPQAGVLSAWGIASASPGAVRAARVDRLWGDLPPGDRAAEAARLAELARADLVRDGETRDAAVRVTFTMRHRGAQAILEARDRTHFDQEHRRLFGFARPEAPVEVLTIEVRAEVEEEVPLAPPAPPGIRRAADDAVDRVTLHVPRDGIRTTHSAPVWRWEDLAAGDAILGPALIVGPQTTVVIDPGWEALVRPGLVLDLSRVDAAQPTALAVTDAADPVTLALWGRRFMGIAERMGERLRRVAWSTNIRERLDFSCAVFDAEGRLLANAPHIPVHLGAMGETVRTLAARLPEHDLRSGRSWAVNDPRAGGSHLPDITVITPVFADGVLIAWVGSRGHHADVGGITPGSMPPFSTSLSDEGVLLDGLLLVDEGEWQAAEVRAALTRGPHPARDPATVVADLQAQVAANQLGVDALCALHATVGPRLATHAAAILDHGDAVLRLWLAEFDGPRAFTDALDDGTPIAVRLARTGSPDAPRLAVDFAGTGPASPGNLNAPRAVVRAALLYVLRCALGRDIPLNDGVLRSVDLYIPAGSLLDPPPGAAVVGGNVETSQRIVDVLLGALGLAAASQGTMNNLCLGTSRGSYYETIAGGVGATSAGPGASGVQTHMTNTRITDPEVLERRYPVVLERFAIRSGSGGEGTHRGGDGLIRELRFLEDTEVSLLSQRRVCAPFGLAGGGAGAPGHAELVRDGETIALPGAFARRVPAGSVLRVETPGGGGWGPPDAEDL